MSFVVVDSKLIDKFLKSNRKLVVTQQDLKNPQVGLKDLIEVLQQLRFRANEKEIKELLGSKVEFIPRSYPQRNPSQVAPITMTLIEAIDNNRSFTYETYQEDINRLLGWSYVPVIYLNFFVKWLNTHSGVLNEILTFPESFETELLIDFQYPSKPNTVQRLYTYVTNSPLILVKDLERQKQVESLTLEYLEPLYELYKTTDILSKTQHPLELFVFTLAETPNLNLSQLATSIGMMIPLTIKESHRKFILKHLTEYLGVVTRRDPPPLSRELLISTLTSLTLNSFTEALHILSPYTDFELIEYFGFTPFDTRGQLIQNILVNFTYGGFMVFDRLDMSRVEGSVTQEPPFLTFGTPNRFKILEFSEIDPRLYSPPQLQQLLEILQLYPRSFGTNDLIRRIQQHLTVGSKDQATLSLITPEFKKVFYLIFYLAMYLKGWKGPGNDYPLKSKQSVAIRLNPKTVLILGKIRSLSELKGVYTVSRFNSTYLFENKFLSDEIETLINGKFYQNEISTTLAITGYYYLLTLFGESVKDFDPDQI